MRLLGPRQAAELRFVNTYGAYRVVRHGLRYAVWERGSDEFYRRVGPKPMWSRLQAERVAQGLQVAFADGIDCAHRWGAINRAAAKDGVDG